MFASCAAWPAGRDGGVGPGQTAKPHHAQTEGGAKKTENSNNLTLCICNYSRRSFSRYNVSRNNVKS